MSSRLFTTPEAAQELGVSPNHLEKLRVTGGGPEFIKLGRSVRYEPTALQAYVAARRRRSTSDQGGTL
ncbi:helix-turn-helix domain-containing protein [Methylobacterium sp. NI91]|uniref:Helix-turn-helix domain-containing protein n=1 Tax=Methylorubrum podarium TaxID=200476 RepID=A0ABV1QKT4_9HYPH|nr:MULTISPECIES: helix-turn-helix domain-containing protein [unclassified Methylobacterium]QIJ75078.1 helix-turn-helix domain-containing protein [Methylobacterium sp. CLZ]QIJ79982.1 helix-turn-helix domain-containing protein [Methylobacterium sp. NI91]